jgi:sensor histidine kinase YesM
LIPEQTETYFPIFNFNWAMKHSLDIKKVWLYLWMVISYLLLWVLHNATKYPGSFHLSLWNNLWRAVYIIVVNYVFFEYTVPFVLKKRSYLIYNFLLGAFLFWVHLMFWSFGLYGWRSLGITFNIYTELASYPTTNDGVTAQMAYSTGSVFFFGIVRHVYNYVNLKAAAKQLRIEKQEAELNYLKSQTNPHFLFNTLNNIYSLARDKSDLAPESILRLSKILRFMLYETSGNFISIDQELKIMADYIALERLRYDETLMVNFNYDVEDMKQALPPLLLIPLVENAFKHGVSETRGRPFVDIHLSVNKRQLDFIVKNSCESGTGIAIKENIGLSNLRRQLELLYKEYSLSARQDKELFIAHLKINLGSHV